MRRRKHSSNRIRVIVFLAILILPVFYLGKRVYRYVDSRLEEQRLKKEVLILQAENEVLKQRINEYKKGRLVETKAREELGMIKKGEKIYIIKEK